MAGAPISARWPIGGDGPKDDAGGGGPPAERTRRSTPVQPIPVVLVSNHVSPETRLAPVRHTAPVERPDPLDALEAQDGELDAIVAPLDASGLLAPSPRCPGWTVADVLLHLAQTNEMAVASAEDRLPAHVDAVAASLPRTGSIDDWAGALVDLERGDPIAARDRWRASAVAQRDALRACGPDARLGWVAGELAARTLATTRLTETWIHTVDAALAVGPAPEPTDRLWHTCRLAWRTVPYALAQGGAAPAGEVAFVLEAPDGATWAFGPDDAPTTIRGSAVELCTVAGQRARAADTGLVGEGPDADAVLRLVRTFA
jgi:uncharacterized protein (TIGR03084 family)